jgi:hypothetical protein
MVIIRHTLLVLGNSSEYTSKPQIYWRAKRIGERAAVRHNLFHILLLLWHNYGSMECMCVCVCMYVRKVSLWVDTRYKKR